MKYVTIGDDFTSQSGLWMSAYDNYYGYKYNPTIMIGNNVHFSKNCHLSAINKIELKDNVLLGSNVMINDNSHGKTEDISRARCSLPLETKGDILIGENTFIGDNSVIAGSPAIFIKEIK